MLARKGCSFHRHLRCHSLPRPAASSFLRLPAFHASTVDHCPSRHFSYAVHSSMQSASVSELDPQIEQLVKSIHANSTKAVVYATGGAVQAISWLLSVPGASNTIIEASVPYARESLMDMLHGEEPQQYCSEETAVQIAKAAYRRAAVLTGFDTSFVGVGATCALASVPIKRGAHRAYIACHGSFGTKTLSLDFAKGERSRLGEDDVASRAVLKLLADATGTDSSGFRLPLLTQPAGPDGHVDVVAESERAAGDPIEDLLAGKIRCVEYAPGGRVVVDAPRTHKVVLPGSFNPLHEGHIQLRKVAVQRFGVDMEGCFELSVGNPDKGMLPADEVRRRVAQFVSADLPLVITRCPLFINKADLMHKCKFVVGYDTAYRIVMPKYYGDSYTTMLLDFARLRHQGCSFIVAGRWDATASGGAFKGLADVDMPPELADLFEGISESDFRVDLSSTELRQKAQRAEP